MSEQPTRFAQIVARIKSNPLIAALIMMTTIVVTLSSFTNAANNLMNVFFPAKRPDINGEWVAELTYPSTGINMSESFQFGGDGEDLYGSASFLGVKRGIAEGKASGGKLQFVTETQEVVGDWNNPKPVVHRYKGKVSNGEIKFVMQTEGSASPQVPIEFIAHRVDNPSP